MEKFKSWLEQLGLTKNEILVFWTLVQAGQSTILELLDQTHLKRSTLYFILDQLEQKKFVKFLKKGSHRYYIAASFDELKKLLTEKKESLEQHLNSFDHLIPELSLLTPLSPDKPRLQYFEGRSGVRALFGDMLTYASSEILYVGSPALFEQLVGKAYLKKFISQRIQNKIRSRAIWSWPNKGHDYKPGQESLREVRLAPEGFVAPTGVFIYGDNVSLLSEAREGFGVITHSKDFHQTMKNWFELLWSVCKR